MIYCVAIIVMLLFVLVRAVKLNLTFGRTITKLEIQKASLSKQRQNLIEETQKLDDIAIAARADRGDLLKELNKVRDREGKILFYVRQFCKNLQGKNFRNKKGPLEKCAAFKLLQESGEKKEDQDA